MTNGTKAPLASIRPLGSPTLFSVLSACPRFCPKTVKPSAAAQLHYLQWVILVEPMSVFRPLLLVLSALPCLAATFGTVVPHAQPLADLVIDEARKRLYVVNTYSSTVEVYATNVSPPRQTNTIKTDATPLSLALSRDCLLYTSPSPRDRTRSRMPS